MLKFNRKSPPTKDEVIDLIRSLPGCMVCTHYGVDLDAEWIPSTTMADPIKSQGETIQKVTIIFERAGTE